MKTLLASIAKHLRKFATHNSANDAESVPAPVRSSFPGERQGSGFRRDIPSAPNTAISQGISRQQNINQPQQRIFETNQVKDARSANANFITRRELERELELLRRLIESRK